MHAAKLVHGLVDRPSSVGADRARLRSSTIFIPYKGRCGMLLNSVLCHRNVHYFFER